jgi:hypothetical protein
VVDDFHSRAYMSGSFGYGTKGLGDVYLDTPHSLNGAQMISKPSFNADTSTKTLHADGDLLAGSHTGSGSEVAGNYDIVSKSTLASGSVWKPFSGSGGYKSYDKSHLNHANVIEVTWEKTGYPGYWYLYQKSVIADDPNNNNVYGFNGPEYKFTSSAGSGYHSS